MTKSRRQLLLGFLIAVFLTPIGILLPHWLNAGDAWGEWSISKLKEMIGYVPREMQKSAEFWKAPVNDYNLAGENSSLINTSFSYIISAIIGVVIILAISVVIYKIIRRNESKNP